MPAQVFGLGTNRRNHVQKSGRVRGSYKATFYQYPILSLYAFLNYLSSTPYHMFTSSRYSYLALRFGLAVVFLWFCIDKILHPAYWLNAWVPQGVQLLIAKFSLTGIQFIYVNFIFEILVGLSLVTGVFTKFFSALAIIFLLSVLVFVSISEVTVRDFGLLGGFIAVLLWPDGRSRF